MYLSLTLVIGVFGLTVATNIALGRTSVESSIYSGELASHGNDGNMATIIHTKTDNPSWWCVILDTVYNFRNIVVYNRNDNNFAPTRINGFEIRVQDVGGCNAAAFRSARICHKDTTGIKHVYTIDGCNKGGAFSGRFVYINTAGSKILHFRELQIYGTAKYTNIALGRTSVESSIYSGEVASHGNDGNMATINHTHKDNPSWWCVILDTVYNFMNIVVYNRKGFVSNRMNGFEIRVQDVGGCNAAAFRSAKICHKDTTGTKDVYTIDGCNKGGSFSGRFVYINTAGSHCLHFRELQISGTAKYINRAFKQPSVESSIYGNEVASRSNDGDMGTSAHTQQDNPSWWCVKLGNIYNFLHIVVYNSADANSIRLKGFEIRVQDFGACNAEKFKSARICHQDSTGNRYIYTIDGCNKGGDFSGRYVYINTAGSQFLHVRELQVYGIAVKGILPNIASNTYVMQSSTNGLSTAKFAVDDDLKTCSLTNVGSVSWLCVELRGQHVLDSISLTQKYDAKISGYEIRLEKRDICFPGGYKLAELCYKDTSGADAIQQCNQNGVLFSARSIYIGVANSAFNLCDINVLPAIGTGCSQS